MRTLIIDTNVLISDPTCIFKFKENKVVIPATVLHELDNLKDRRGKESITTEVRESIRLIESVIGDASPAEIVKGVPITYPEGMEDTGGTLTVRPDGGSDIDEIMSKNALSDKPDNRIIALALSIQEKEEVSLVSNDVNMRLIASATGVERVELYRNDLALDDAQLLTSGLITIKQKSWAELEDYEIIFEGEEKGPKQQYVVIPRSNFDKPYIGGNVLFNDENKTLLGTIEGFDANVVRIKQKDYESLMKLKAWGIKPRNHEQALGFDMLLDASVEAVVLFGPAGTGKTICACAAALDLVLEQGKYDKIICTRSLADLDVGIGYTPGDEQSKMSTWLGGFEDAIETLHKQDERDAQASFSTSEYIIEKANIQFRSITKMRGRSLNDAVIIIDESQNLTNYQMKSLVSRVSSNCKLILLGNLNQIDKHGISPLTSGLTHLVVKAKNYEGIRSLHLPSIERSGLAEFAENFL